MGFRIRDKSLFWTKSGWKNNWEPKVLNMPRACHPHETAYISCRYDHYSFLRIVQSYRNYSRILKQYLYGNKEQEEVVQMALRSAFKIPLTCQTPVELLKDGGERRMADQLDRDYEVMSYNYHPYQLYSYKLRNQYMKQLNEEAQKIQNGEATPTMIFEEAFRAEIEAESKKLGVGEKISLEKLAQIFNKLCRQMDEQLGQSNTTRTEDGEFNDYVEKRRPFTEASNTSQSH